MAKDVISLNTEIEQVATKGNLVFKRIMTMHEALLCAKKPGWIYRNYQIGFCSLKNNPV